MSVSRSLEATGFALAPLNATTLARRLHPRARVTAVAVLALHAARAALGPLDAATLDAFRVTLFEALAPTLVDRLATAGETALAIAAQSARNLDHSKFCHDGFPFLQFMCLE